MNKVTIINFLLIALSYNLSYAQVPQKIPYQAIARNAQGQPISNQLIAVKFNIQDSALLNLFEEIQYASTNNLGLFQLNLGEVNTLNIDWASGAKFLKVSIDVNGGIDFVDFGTSPFLSVPYALYAANAGNTQSPVSISNINLVGNDLVITLSDGSSQTVPLPSFPSSSQQQNNQTLIYTTNGF